MNTAATSRRFLALIVSMIALLGNANTCLAETKRVLLSVAGLDIPDGEALTAFRIETWGIAFLAVCRMPPSWEIRAEKYEDPEGFLSGRSDIHGAPLKSLDQMFLVDVYNYQPLPRGKRKGEYHPSSFAGWIETRGSSAEHGARRALHSRNFRLTPATNCPIAPPHER